MERNQGATLAGCAPFGIRAREQGKLGVKEACAHKQEWSSFFACPVHKKGTIDDPLAVQWPGDPHRQKKVDLAAIGQVVYATMPTWLASQD